MKRPTKPPTSPGSPMGPDGPSSGRARKDVNYIPTTPPVPPQPRSVSPMRAPPPLPSTRTAAADEYELMEDMATPMRTSNKAAIEPTTGPAAPPSSRRDLGPGSIRDLAAMAAPASLRDLAAPPPTSGHWDPPAHASGPLPTGPMQPLPPPSSRGPFGPSSQQSMQAIQQASSGRMRQVDPHPSVQAPVSQGPVNQITGPLMPVVQRPSEPSHSAVPSSARRPAADDGVPLGYVVASAFFLAIALVGFGLYLAFEVF